MSAIWESIQQPKDDSMKRYSMPILLVVTLLVAAFPVVGAGQSTDVLFQEAQRLERVQGDYQGAIGIYQQIVGGASTERGAVARALVQMGKAYESLGRTEAFSVYERVVRDFADVDEQVSEARSRMRGLATVENPAQSTPEKMRQPGSMSSLSFTGGGSYGMDISPDGRYLAFIDGFYQDVQTGADIEFETAEDCHMSTVRFSPDGSRLAYGCWGNAGAGVIDLASGSATRILDADEYFGENGDYEVEVFDWTRDGSNVLVAIETSNNDVADLARSSNHLILQPTGGGVPTIVDPNYAYDKQYFWENNACLMRNDQFVFGDWMTFGEDGTLYIQRISVETQERENVLLEAGRNFTLMGCDKVANILYYQEALSDGNAFLWSAKVEEDGGLVKRKRLQQLPGNSWAHPIAQDGNLYFTLWGTNPSRRSWSGEISQDTGVARIDGSGETGRLLDWSNDGRYRMGMHPYSTVDVVVTDSDTDSQTQLDVGDFPQRWGFLSGDRVMIAHSGRDLERTWVFDIETGSPIDSLDGQFALGVMPDGESLVFADSTTGSLCLVSMRLEDRSETPFTCLPGAIASMETALQISRNGEVAWVRYTDCDDERLDRVFALDGSMDQIIDVDGRGIELLPDGSGAFLIGERTLDLLDFESGVERSFDSGLEEGYVIRLHRWKLHPDGTRFEASLHPPQKDLMVIHNVRGLLDGAK
jgi:hypothetical protein